MKKILLGTSALVVAALATPAFAQAPASGFATSTGIGVTIGGYARQFLQYTDQTNVAGNVRSSGVDQTSDNRLILNFRAALPSGMSAGAVWQINPNANTATGNSITRRMWSFIEGGFGQVQLGGADNVAAQASVGSFEAFTGGFVVGDQNSLAFATNRVGVTAQSSQASNSSTGMDIDGISNKVVYYTPRIEGFQAGINYTPEMSYRQGLALTNNQYTNGWAGNVNYTNTLGGVAVRASAGYITFEKPSGYGNSAAINASSKNPNSWQAGLGLQYQGFDIGGSYQKVNDWNNIAVGTTTLGAGSTQTAAAAASLADGFRRFNGYSWEAGIGYIFGQAAVSLNYTTSQNDNSTVTNGVVVQQALGRDKMEIVGASGRYTLAPGVIANLGVFTAKYTEGTPNTNAAQNTSFFTSGQQSSRANGVVSGLTLTF